MKRKKPKQNNANPASVCRGGPRLNLELPVRNASGQKVGAFSLSGKVFDGEVNLPVLHQVITMYNANRRSGTASCKTRGDVRGGGKKPWRQKGTGRARTGSIRNPLWRGGGVIFGPHPRDFSYTMPRQVKRNALRSSLNAKLAEDNLIIFEDIKLEQPKTKVFKKFLTSMGVKDKEGAIVILDKADKNIRLASRNIPNLALTSGGNFNAGDIVRHKKVIIQKSAIVALMKDLAV